jgi:hypothetical protein
MFQGLQGIEVIMHQYAWLELEDDMWHFMTSLTAEPEESSRRWRDRQCALAELSQEGWSVVRPYPGISEMRSESGVQGYGLSRYLPETTESYPVCTATENRIMQ